jgi:hypothetical protein
MQESVATLRTADATHTDGLRTLSQQSEQMVAFRAANQQQMEAFREALAQHRADNRAAMDKMHDDHMTALTAQEKRWSEAHAKLTTDALTLHSKLTTDAITLLQETLFKTMGRKVMEWVLTIAGSAALATIIWFVAKFSAK